MKLSTTAFVRLQSTVDVEIGIYYNASTKVRASIACGQHWADCDFGCPVVCAAGLRYRYIYK